MDPQFKLLQLESCLEREVYIAETVKGCGYSKVASEVAKKIWRRKAECPNMDELRRMRQITERNRKA